MYCAILHYERTHGYTFQLVSAGLAPEAYGLAAGLEVEVDSLERPTHLHLQWIHSRVGWRRRFRGRNVDALQFKSIPNDRRIENAVDARALRGVLRKHRRDEM